MIRMVTTAFLVATMALAGVSATLDAALLDGVQRSVSTDLPLTSGPDLPLCC
ncbi:hypothetical protein [Streptomyces spinosus]|uniref:hypothetical protein n=1 Tax=Streptomyces spinosus TaxID=2872623 RepID=UPI001CED5889|nr:hypothetical protein [Streptomyces spinosus]